MGEVSRTPTLEFRQGCYAELFQDEYPDDPLDMNAAIGISGLARVTQRSGSRSRDLQEHLQRLPQIVDAVLTEHDAAARDPGGEAIFAFVNEQTRTTVGGIVTQIFTQWDITRSRHRLPPLVPDHENTSRWLMMETAVGVMELSSSEIGIGSNPTRDAELLVKLLTCWGPQFARQWLDGTMLNRWLQTEQTPEAEYKTWHAVFTPSVCRQFALNNITDPLGALKRTKYALETVLTDENLAKELDWPVDTVREMITPETRKRFALAYPLPLEGIRRVKDNLENALADENLAKELSWSMEEVQAVFTEGRKRNLAVHHLTDILGTVKIIKYNLETVMTDENLARVLGWSVEEVRETFSASRRREFAVTHTANPLQAFRNMRHNLTIVLTDTNLGRELDWPVDKVQAYIPPGIRKHFAARYSDPMVIAKTYKRNLETILTDENLAKELSWSMEEVQEILTPSIRRRIAYTNVHDPLQTIRTIQYNLETQLTDENLAKVLAWPTIRIHEMFTPGRRKILAAAHANDPLDAAIQVKKAFENILTDENLIQTLGWTRERVRGTFTPSGRFMFAVNNMRDPLRAAREFGNRLTQTLNDQNLITAVGWDMKTIQSIFTAGVRKRLAMHYPEDPLAAAKVIRTNLETVLADDNLAQELSWDADTVREVFTPELKARYAVNNMDNPLLAAKRLKYNLEVVMTDQNLVERTGWDVTSVRQIFTSKIRKSLVRDHTLDPLTAAADWANGRILS